MPGFDVISEIFGQFAPVEQIDTERQIAFIESFLEAENLEFFFGAGKNMQS